MDVGALVSAFFDLAGPGGVLALSILLLALVVYYSLIRKILGRNDEE